MSDYGIKTYADQQGEDATLSGFLEEVALISDLDSYDENADSVVMMTLRMPAVMRMRQLRILV